MAGAASEGLKPDLQIVQNPFSQLITFQPTETQGTGKQTLDATEYSFEHPSHAVVTAELSKIEQIVEFLKVLYR